ncbi:MAG: hypothetical protein VYC34_12740, partial [Planctomycetota bacterium]|nr:hypothetical protein [Planctomycetota bacterium]
WSLDLRAAEGVFLPSSEVRAAANEIVDQLRAALCLTNEERDSLRCLLNGIADIEERWGELSVAEQKRTATRGWFGDAISIIRIRDASVAERVCAEVERLAETASGLAPTPLITGDDLIAAGLRPGPAFGQALARVYDAQLEERVSTREGAMALARSILESEND